MVRPVDASRAQLSISTDEMNDHLNVLQPY